MDQGSVPIAAGAPKQDQAADQLQAIAAALEAEGFSDAARLAFMAAANIDLANPELQRCWGGPMNGQHGRAAAFLALAAALPAAAVVETGTFRGTTTEWMAANLRTPIHTCEIDPRLFYQAREKLSVFGHVRCVMQDSRAFLRDLLPTLPTDGAVVFYLDAHWHEDLPLREEIDLILSGHPLAVIMIDDFAVPFDAGYTWDDYGPGKQLTLELLCGTEARDARLFFPALPSEAETGAKRGCCVIAKDAGLAARIAALPHFRGADWREWRLVELAGQLERAGREAAQLRQQVSQAVRREETLAVERADLERALREAAEAASRREGALLLEKAELEHALGEAVDTASRREEALALEKAELERVLREAGDAALGREEAFALEKAALELALGEADAVATQQRERHILEVETLREALAAADEKAANDVARLSAALASAHDDLARAAHYHAQEAFELRRSIAAMEDRASSVEVMERQLAAAIESETRARENALAELRVRERELAQRDAELLTLGAHLEDEKNARAQLAEQLRVMKAYCGIIE